MKTGAGQYFTPRPLIEAIVEVVEPEAGRKVCDPACGTGGFLLAAYERMKNQPRAKDRAIAKKLRHSTFTGYDIVPGVVRLAAMNLYLHGIGEDESPILRADALPPPEEIAAEIVESLEAALLRFKSVASKLAG